ncbi:MAG: 23S rRNA (uracil(1939)-C(5))-methyltransferase RlmD [Vicinamibacterales bacterium]
MATSGRGPRSGREHPPTQELDVDIESLSIEGDGVAHAGRHTIYVPFTIPGERVRVQLRGTPRPFAAGILLDVLRASPHRVSPKCRHFGSGAAAGLPCGGCTWQHIAYPEQLRLKSALVDRLVRAQVSSAPRASAMRSAQSDQPWGFRQKVHFVFGEGAGRRGSRDLLMGHYARGSRDVVGVTECPVHDTRGNALAVAMHRQFVRARIQADAGQGAALQSIVVRAAHGTDELMATLVISHETDRHLRTATRKVMETAPPGSSFHLNVHDRDDGFIFGTRTRKLAGAERLRDKVGESSYLISPTAFFQTNVAAAALLVSTVLEMVPTVPGRVLDLYAGAGLFAIPLARAGHTVTAVESNRQAVADGIASARLNRLTDEQCRFIVARTEDALSSASRADIVVLDPPREGCAPGVIDRLFGQVRPPLAVYVSCNPEALATELAMIVRHGYQIRSLVPVDMFPHTAHVETVAVLTR